MVEYGELTFVGAKVVKVVLAVLEVLKVVVCVVALVGLRMVALAVETSKILYFK